MYRGIIDGDKLRELLPDLPEDLAREKLEIFVRIYSDDSEKMEDVLQQVKKRVNRSAFLGKEKEVFFFESDEIPEELRKPVVSKLKELGYTAEMKEGARGTVVLTIRWKNT